MARRSRSSGADSRRQASALGRTSCVSRNSASALASIRDVGPSGSHCHKRGPDAPTSTVPTAGLRSPRRVPAPSRPAPRVIRRRRRRGSRRCCALQSAPALSTMAWRTAARSVGDVAMTRRISAVPSAAPAPRPALGRACSARSRAAPSSSPPPAARSSRRDRPPSRPPRPPCPAARRRQDSTRGSRGYVMGITGCGAVNAAPPYRRSRGQVRPNTVVDPHSGAHVSPDAPQQVAE